MGKLDEYLRLPHGMFDRDSKWEKRAREILKNHEEVGRNIGCEVKKYTPLGYSETYQRGTNAANYKVYKFDSKTGKSLMLSSDSTPSIFREYVASGENKSKRISFVAPLFRYRNSHTRHFTQIGYAIINESKVENDIDVNLVELGKGMGKLCDSMGIKIKFHINDYDALKRMLSTDISENEMSDALHMLQFASLEERIEFFKQTIKDKTKSEQLIDLFSREAVIIETENEQENSLNLPEEYLGIYRMAKGLKAATNLDVVFDPTNLHSVETIDNYALRFVTQDGVQLGDGGEYTSYAKRFDDNINTFWSVASGVEALERNSPMIFPPEILKKIAMFNTDADAMFVIQTIKALEDNGYAVVYQGSTNKVGKAIKRLEDDYTHVTVVGKSEELGENIKIRDLNTRETVEIISSNNSKAKDESDLEYQVKAENTESSDTIKDVIKVMKDYFRTDKFDREDLISIIANHSDSNGNMLLSSSDIETLIVEVGKVYKEKGLLDNKDKTQTDRKKVEERD